MYQFTDCSKQINSGKHGGNRPSLHVGHCTPSSSDPAFRSLGFFTPASNVTRTKLTTTSTSTLLALLATTGTSFILPRGLKRG
jgi:hypothetical protein